MSTLAVIKKMTRFRCSELCFEMYACLISFFWCNEQNIESNWFIASIKIFSVFCMWTQIYVFSLLPWMGKSLLFFEDLFWFVHSLVQLFLHTGNSFIITFCIYCFYLLFIHLGESIFDPPDLLMRLWIHFLVIV